MSENACEVFVDGKRMLVKQFTIIGDLDGRVSFGEVRFYDPDLYVERRACPQWYMDAHGMWKRVDG